MLSNWESGKPRPSGLGVLKLSCDRCGAEKYIAADAVLEQTNSYCQRCASQPGVFGREVQHTAEVFLPPSGEADKFIKENNLNPEPSRRVWPPRPWDMAVS